MKIALIIIASIFGAAIIGFFIYRRIVLNRINKILGETMKTIYCKVFGFSLDSTEDKLKNAPKGIIHYLDPVKNENNEKTGFFVKIFKNGKDRKDTFNKEIP